MYKYGIICIMKITITIPKEIYDKLESDRGLIPRSTYIKKLIGGGVKKGGEDLEDINKELGSYFKKSK